MADPKIQSACGNTTFDAFEDAIACKTKVEQAQAKPYRVDSSTTGTGEAGDVLSFYTVSEFPACTPTATFSSYFTQPNRLDANICAQSLSRITGTPYTFQVVPDSWAGVSDAYQVVTVAEYTGAKPTDHFATKQDADDAAKALSAQTGKEYTVVNTGTDYVLSAK